MAKGKYEYWLTEDGLLLLEGWARDGLTDEQLAERVKIRTSTFYEWKKKYPEISEALKKGKEIVDIEVENALLNNAKGYYYTEQVVSTKRTVTYKDGKRVRERSEPIVVDVRRWKPADTTAQIYWTKNRQPTKWRDKPPQEPNETVVVQIVDDIPKK